MKNKAKIAALMESRASAYAEAQAVVDGAVNEDRDLTAEEQSKTDELLGKIRDMTKSIRSLEELDYVDDELNTSAGRAVTDVIAEPRAETSEVELQTQGFERTVRCTDVRSSKPSTIRQGQLAPICGLCSRASSASHPIPAPSAHWLVCRLDW